MAKKIPEGFHTVTASLTVNDAAKAIDFYKRALGATEVSRAAAPDGKIMHAEVKIGNSIIFLNDEMMGMKSAKSLGASPVTFYLYVEDVDGAFKRAVDSGAQAKMPVTDMFWGDRYGTVTDPFGLEWGLATHVEDVAPAEMERRQKQMFASMSQAS